MLFVVAKRRFEQLVSGDSNLIVKTRPNEGDLIYFGKVNKMFEISFVDHDDPFYQVHNVPAYKLKVKTFEYSSEDIDTGIAEIDQIAQTIGTTPRAQAFSVNALASSTATDGDNFAIEERSDSVLDFSEDNPFGSF